MLGEYNMGIVIKNFSQADIFMSNAVSHFAEIAAKQHKIVMM